MQLEKEVTVAIIETLPLILGVITLLIVVVVFKNPLKQRIIPRLSGLKILGVEITLLKDSLDEAVTEHKVPVSEGDKWSALKRAQHVLPVLQGAKLLWVDDEPHDNQRLIKLLLSLKANVDQAQDTEEALKLLRRHQYDAVISDISRKEGESAGVEMVSKMWDERIYRWTIFYVQELKPGIPKHAFNITNRPDHLLHFIMDVLEREKWGEVAAK